MTSRGKRLVQLALSKDINNADKLENSKRTLEDNVQANSTISEDVLLNTALLHDCLFADNVSLISTNVDHITDPSFITLQPAENDYSVELKQITDPNEFVQTTNPNEFEQITDPNEYEQIIDPNWSADYDSSNNESSTSTFSDNEILQVVSQNETTKNDNKYNVQITNEEESSQGDKENKRKKRCNEREWKRNERKRNRNIGVAHINSRKKKVAERKMQEPCKITSCVFKCAEKIYVEDRLSIFKRFWNLGDLERQRNYILQCLTVIPHTKTAGQRKPNRAFYFKTKNSSRIRVCKIFFTHTLGISDRVIRTVIDKTKDGFLEKDKRGKHGHQRKVDESIKQGVIEHINSIPRVESHYLRAQSTREFIDGGKTLADIHRDYKKICETRGQSFANYTMFSRIFRSNFNISFFTPKKDQCGTCEQYNNSNDQQKLVLEEKYERHLKEKDLSRLEKEKDKQLAKSKECISLCFDLQAVLQTPCGDINSFYYKSKLSTYNFTIFDLGTLEGNCFIWHEGEGNRGANEIGTCLYKFLDTNCSSNKPVVLYCDNCSGQNKNKFIASMLLYATKHLNIPSISLKFLVVGHTQNEGDNMHSLIEKQKKRALKSGPVYIPAQWTPIIGNAKKTGTPYNINELDYTDFWDLKCLQESMGNNFTHNEEGERVLWNYIAILKFLKEDSSGVYYKNSYSDQQFKKIIIRKAGRRVTGRSDDPNIELKSLYSDPLKISQVKLEALSDLCNKNYIKRKFHEFYKSLGCNIQPLVTREEKKVTQEKNKKKQTTKKKEDHVVTTYRVMIIMIFYYTV